MIKKLPLPNLASQSQRQAGFPALHELGQGLVAVAHRRQQKMHVVGHEAHFLDTPTKSFLNALQRFHGCLNSLVIHKNSSPLGATRRHEVHDRLVERKPDWNPGEVFALGKSCHVSLHRTCGGQQSHCDRTPAL
jgi:hypothetical protein